MPKYIDFSVYRTSYLLCLPVPRRNNQPSSVAERHVTKEKNAEKRHETLFQQILGTPPRVEHRDAEQSTPLRPCPRGVSRKNTRTKRACNFVPTTTRHASLGRTTACLLLERINVCIIGAEKDMSVLDRVRHTLLGKNQGMPYWEDNACLKWDQASFIREFLSALQETLRSDYTFGQKALQGTVEIHTPIALKAKLLLVGVRVPLVSAYVIFF